MKLILIFAVLLGSFLIIGTIAAVHIDRHPEEHEDAPENPSRVVISQPVSSVFDTLKEKDKK